MEVTLRQKYNTGWKARFKVVFYFPRKKINSILHICSLTGLKGIIRSWEKCTGSRMEHLKWLGH